jgi:hypothetical protein
MDENLTSKASHRITGNLVPAGRVSNPFASPGQNGGFSDGFLTKRRVDACHSGQPGKSSDPKNPMKSIDYPPCKGSPAHPPPPQSCEQDWGGGVYGRTENPLSRSPDDSGHSETGFDCRVLRYAKPSSLPRSVSRGTERSVVNSLLSWILHFIAKNEKWQAIEAFQSLGRSRRMRSNW